MTNTLPPERPDPKEGPALRAELDRERSELLSQYEEWLEIPSLVLGLAWLVLLIVDLTGRLSPLMAAAINVIWIIFLVDFAIRLVLAPRKLAYLRANWLTVISLALPAVRLLRVARLVRLLRAARTVRSLQLVRTVGSLNRGMRALGRSFGRRGFGYVLALTVIVTLVGSAGMYALESNAAPTGTFSTYGESLWWTAMTMTTMGADSSPQTAEGRILGFLLALYALAVFGYVTATLATFFIGRDAEDAEGELAGANEIQALRGEIQALRAELAARRPGPEGGGPPGMEPGGPQPGD